MSPSRTGTESLRLHRRSFPIQRLAYRLVTVQSVLRELALLYAGAEGADQHCPASLRMLRSMLRQA